MITATCGHDVDSVELEELLFWLEQNREGKLCIAYGSFCPDCARRWMSLGWGYQSESDARLAMKDED